MVTVHQLVSFGLVALVLIAIPGPSVVFTIGRALAYGRPVALLTVLGNSLGLVAIAVLVALGLSVVVRESITAFLVLKLAGAAYLVWLGVQAIRHRREFIGAGDPGDPGDAGLAGRRLNLMTALRQGFVVGASNPKAFLIFGAVLPPFVDRSAGGVTGQLLALGLLAVLIGLVSDSVWAIVASQLRTWFLRSRRRGEALGAVGGVSMIGLGIATAVTGNDT